MSKRSGPRTGSTAVRDKSTAVTDPLVVEGAFRSAACTGSTSRRWCCHLRSGQFWPRCRCPCEQLLSSNGCKQPGIHCSPLLSSTLTSSSCCRSGHGDGGRRAFQKPCATLFECLVRKLKGSTHPQAWTAPLRWCGRRMGTNGDFISSTMKAVQMEMRWKPQLFTREWLGTWRCRVTATSSTRPHSLAAPTLVAFPFILMNWKTATSSWKPRSSAGFP